MNPAEPDESPTAPTAPARGRTRGRAVWIAVAVLVLLAGGYVAAYLLAGDNVPRGTTVAGVRIGGLSHDDAVDRLERDLADRVAEPFPAEVAGNAKTVAPAAAGLAVDHEASVEEVSGTRSWAPTRLWDHFTGGDDADAVVRVDESKLAAEIERLEGKSAKKARNGSWRFEGARPKEIAPVVGRALDRAATQDALVSAYQSHLAGDTRTVDLELVEVQPGIDAEDMQQAREEFVEPAMSGPVTLLFGEAEATLQPRQFVRVLRLTPKRGELVPELRTRRLERLVGRFVADGAPVDATVRLEDGKPVVVPGRLGVSFDAQELRSEFLRIVTASGDQRSARLSEEAKEPEFTTEEAEALQIKERVSEATTHYPHAEYRNVNIGRAAELIDGTVLKPGDTFSLNGIVGERTAENGFTEGYMILDGILVQDLGGGVSQIATTTFNAMFYAGLKDVEHKPHSFYISRYPAGREATVAWPSLDLKFQNDTPYGVLVEAFIDPSTPSTQGSVTVRMYSTKYWDITDESSARYAYVPPKTRTLTTPDCEEHEGSSGFQVDVWRHFRKAGSEELVRTEKFHTSYKPADHVVCEDPATGEAD